SHVVMGTLTWPPMHATLLIVRWTPAFLVEPRPVTFIVEIDFGAGTWTDSSGRRGTVHLDP
ncbi:MAG: hypothetical protein Q8S13_09295, partial [Dehalococcoidia bacterium]|nr:hypothetical protein [Dehalococcoidia bacterium]